MSAERPPTRAEVVELLDRYADKFDKSGRLLERGKPKRTRANLGEILSWDPEFEGPPRYNEFTGRVELNGEPLSDALEAGLALEISRHYACDFGTGTVHEVLTSLAQEHRYHPVRDYLDGLRWDGVERLPTWLHRYLGASDSELHAAYGLAWAIGCVARVYRPGCKLDTVLILAGPQGARKSTAFRVLGGAEWFSDTPIDIRHKDAYQSLVGCWLLEWAELDSVRRRDATMVKAFVSSPVDRYRPSYGRNVVEWPRQCVIVGTTNEAGFLADATGSRRFWPVKVGRIQIEDLAEDRDQLWAEAVERYRRDQPWWLDESLEAARAEAAEDFEDVDSWEQPILHFIRGKDSVTTTELLKRAVELDLGQHSRAAQMRAGAVMAKAGWVQVRRVGGTGRRVRMWVPPD